MSKGKNKEEMVKAGKVEDLRVFKLMYLEKSVSETKLMAELKRRAFNDQIEQLKIERQSQAKGFELRAKALADEILQIRKMFEEEYEISLAEWGYDDATGVLVPLSHEVLERIHSQRALQKDIDVEKSEEKKKRVRKKRKLKLPVGDSAPAEVESKEGEQKPPTATAEA